MTERNNVKLKFYVSYVDNTFVLFNKKSHIEQFIVFLNTWHNNLKFIFDSEHYLMLPFVDVNVIKTDSGLMSSTHYKQTHTRLYTNFCTNLCDTYKKGAFTGLISYLF